MKCEHEQLELHKLTLTPHLIHYGRFDCGQCGAFLGWCPKPATVERIALNEKKLAHCKNGNGLIAWEVQFAAKLDPAKLSPKQQACLDKICNSTGCEA